MVQKFFDAKYQTPSDIHCNWRKDSNYVGRGISTPIPFYFHSQNDRGFKILWMEYIEHSSYFFVIEEGGQNMIAALRYIPFLFPIPIGKKVQSIIAAIYWTPSIFYSQWGGCSKYYGCGVFIPFWFLLLLERGFKLLWPRTEHPSISNSNWRGYLKYYDSNILNPFLFSIHIEEGVQSINAANYLSPPHCAHCL